MQSSSTNNLTRCDKGLPVSEAPIAPEDLLLPKLHFTPAEVATFQSLLEEAVGHPLSHSDAEVEVMARNAVALVLVLRDIARRRAGRGQNQVSI